MYTRLCLKFNTSKYTEKAKEILIFQKCSCTPFMNLNANLLYREVFPSVLIYGVRSNSDGVKLSSAYPINSPFSQIYIACSTPSKQT